jgi:hypothetical protein
METKTYTGTGSDIVVLGQDAGTIERVELDGVAVEGACVSLYGDIFCLVRPHSSNDGVWQAGAKIDVTADWKPKPAEPVVIVPVVEEIPIVAEAPAES